MERGLVFALLAAVSIAASTVYIRKVVSQTGEAFTGAAITVFTGVLFFTASIFLSGGWSKLWSISGKAFILLAAAGILHFAAGRLLAYTSLRLIGANKASAFVATMPFYALILGVIFLNESITTYLILGVSGIVGGASLVSFERKSVSEGKQKGAFGTEVKGIVAALGAAACWGTSPILIKPAVEEIGSPAVAAFVSYIAAAIVMALLLSRRQHRQQMRQLRFAGALVPLVISGIVISFSQLLRFTALGYSPASMVTPLMSTAGFFIYLFSFFVNRDIEVFTPKVISGMVIIAIGTFFIFY